MTEAPRYGVSSMVEPLRRVLIRRPATTGDFAAADWRQPDPERLLAEHEAFGELLEHLGCEVVVADPVEGMVDSVYVCDPVWTCQQGAIVLQSAKPARVGEGEAMVPELEAAGVPIVPIVVRNSLDALPKNWMVVRSATIDVVVLPPIATTGWTRENLPEHIAEIERMYAETISRPTGAATEASRPLDG